MKTQNLFDVVRNRTQDMNKKSKSAFNTNDWLVENLVDKTFERSEVINMIIVARIEHLGHDTDKMSKEDLGKLIDSLYKTSKNGLDTSVSDSNNNSSFSYNPKYSDYKLVKTGSKLTVKKVK